MLAALDSVDMALLAWLRAFHAPWLDTLMSAASVIGIMAGIWHLVALLSLIPERTRAAAWRVLLSLWLALAVVDLIAKPLFARVRPVRAADVATQMAWAADAESRGLIRASDSYSFPSGHATTAVAGALTVSALWPRYRVVWWSLGALIAYSRIYLGHHYPLDVLAGALLGLAIGYWVLGGVLRRQNP